MTTAAFNNSIRSSLASLFIENQETERVIHWSSMMDLSIGTRVEYQGLVYVSLINGKYTSLQPPTHQQGIMNNLLFLYNRVSLSGIDTNLYLFVGKSTEWNNSDTEVEDVDLGDGNQFEIIKNIISLKKLKRIDSAFCVRRYNWVDGEYYKEYTDSGVQQYPFYVINKSNHIYKCLSNNNGSPSTIEPSGTSSSSILYPDGYIWKYMSTVDPRDAVTFLSTKFIPLRYKLIDDGSPQYITQKAAKKQGVSSFKILFESPDTNFIDPEYILESESGSGCEVYILKDNTNQVSQVVVSNNGSGYRKRPRLLVKETSAVGSGFIGTVTISETGTITGIVITENGSGYVGGASAFIVGDGEGAKVECIIELGIITGINIVEVGNGYTRAEIVLVPGVKAIVAEGVLTPRMGHGYNVLEELSVNVISINVSIPQNSYFPISSSFRQIGIFCGGRDTSGSLLGEEYYTGPSHPNPGGLRKLDPDSGNVIYLNNIEKVERVYGQEERLKIIIEF